MLKRGFTLIELLVVIAIIGILSAVVLASLSAARSKGSDAAIQSDLSTIQTQAEIWYGSNSNSYGTNLAGSCVTTNINGMFRTTAPLGDSNIIRAISAIGGITGGTSNTYMVCGILGNNYFVAARLVTDTTKGWCVDSGGYSTQVTWSNVTTTGLTNNSYACQ
ncbi:MAG: hypothetical protein RLZZ26_68 [Candidatus Parcubacteria bacterium]|jgi:prepilin-type N-terminal cleavage/methylation domain-containing protein